MLQTYLSLSTARLCRHILFDASRFLSFFLSLGMLDVCPLDLVFFHIDRLVLYARPKRKANNKR